MSFTVQLQAFTDVAIGNVEQVFRGTCIGLFTRVIRRTPAVTGRLRGNWQTDISSPAQGIIDRTGESGAINEAVNVSLRAELSDSVFFTNNLPYAVPIESGTSTQAPSGMLKVSVLELEQVVQQQAAQL